MVPQSQVGFINFIVMPTFQLLYELLIKMHKDVKESKDEADSKNIQFPGRFQWMEQLQQNKSTWEDKAIQEAEIKDNSQNE
ncbi:unnamed protein product [Hymenolepis diminuta]|uniref:PDEase domain-containing protein n=1 Tax=Hymenolepis diminuta TaxID=6216 RepID=A0A564YTW0_HYMDI|nr:unnamed protein product [Hymenolepis diminuta]